MNNELVKKTDKTTFEEIVIVSQILLLISTAVVTAYQINQLIKTKNDEKS